MKSKKLMRTTTNPSVYRKARKRYLAYQGRINCDYCPYHKNENASRDNRRCWKQYRKNQWRK